MNQVSRIAFFFYLLISSHLADGQGAHKFSMSNDQFLLDGNPFLMISGEMHYTRVPREAWRDRMKMAKAMGLNTIGTYVFWNAHEPSQGRYVFTGNNDISAFLQAAKEEGLWVVLRPSPYVCAEWEFGGYPWWLLKDSTVKVRSNDKRFVAAYTKYIKALSKHLAPHLVTNGGNVLMVQLENEYGSFGNDKLYLELNRKIFRDAGFNCILFTCDGADKLASGYLPGYLPAINGLEDTAMVKKLVDQYHDGKGPYYIAEWYPGWFDQWGKQHASVSASRNAESLDRILRAGISVNMYMFHGGTTRDFMNGANMNVNEPYAPQVSSYDYDAPLDEAGNPTEKFYRFRDVIAKYTGHSLPAVPEKKKSVRIDDIRLTLSSSLFSNLPLPLPKTTEHPPAFEDINQAYGMILYRSVITNAKPGYLKLEGLRDYAVVYVNGVKLGELDRRLGQDSIYLDAIYNKAQLDLLVENNGRINYGPYLTDNRKGILGKVTINKHEVTEWKVYSLPFNNLKGFGFSSAKIENNKPALYSGFFTLKETADTYLDMRSFGKGFVFINGHNLGKYWQIGPQHTIYVPACWLKKGQNQVVVFDMLKSGHTSVPTLAQPVLNQPMAAKQ